MRNFTDEVHNLEVQMISEALTACNGSIAQAAAWLALTRQTLSAMLLGRHKDLLPLRTAIRSRNQKARPAK